MRSQRDIVTFPQSGDPGIQESFLRKIGEAATTGNLPPGAFVDATGIYARAPLVTPNQFGKVSIKNTIQSSLTRGCILDISDLVTTLDENEDDYRNERFVFNGIAPSQDQSGRFCILLEDIASNAIGEATVLGLRAVTLLLNSDSDQWADTIESYCDKLGSYPSGIARILWTADTVAGAGGQAINTDAIVMLGGGGGSEATGVAKWIQFTATEKFYTSSPSFKVQVNQWWDGSDPDPNDGGIYVQNPPGNGGCYRYYGDAGTPGEALLKKEADIYLCIQLAGGKGCES